MTEAEQLFEQVYRTYGPSLYRFCLIQMKNPADAEDILQEVFCKRLYRAPVFASPDHERRWLFRVALNQCRDAWKRSSRSELPLEAASAAVTPEELGLKRCTKEDLRGGAPEENAAITRAEFTTLAVRFFDVYGDGNKDIMEQYKDFGDVSDGYWAAEYIKAAAKSGWINGYEDGSFRADRNISRAEVVTIVNRLLGREADESYIADNLRKLNTFSDMSGKHWAYYAVMEAANAHTAILGDNETWSK